MPWQVQGSHYCSDSASLCLPCHHSYFNSPIFQLSYEYLVILAYHGFCLSVTTYSSFLIIQSFTLFTVCQFRVRFLGDSVCLTQQYPYLYRGSMPRLLIGHNLIFKSVALGFHAHSWFRSAEVGELGVEELGKGRPGRVV